MSTVSYGTTSIRVIMQHVRDLDVVVETRQRLDEHVSAFVCELVTTGREEVQRFVEIKVKMSKTRNDSSSSSSSHDIHWRP